VGPARREMPTVTDPVELEAARVASTFTSPPPAIEQGEVEVPEDAILGDYESQLGSLDQIPVIAVSSADLTALSLDPRAGFLLALVDGALDIRTI
ncbi:hypothetical protein, partial [Pseudomonas protegens]|uniref:hypothetical protein n=1 Tax=Pseudomonas protegens TaxID=380021 RepID=UPI000CD391E7